MLIPFKLIPDNLHINFINKRHYAFIFSTILTIFVLVNTAINGLNLGIDFSGGTLIEMTVQEQYSAEDLRQIISAQKYGNFSIQEYKHQRRSEKLDKKQPNQQSADSRITNPSKNMGANTMTHEEIKHQGPENRRFILRLPPSLDGSRISSLKTLLIKEFSATLDRVEYVGPKVGSGFMLNAISALSIALVVMMMYTWSRFDWQFGVGVIVALFHDAIATIGFYSVTRYEFDLTSIAALLTIIGYSINDSMVIYDRIRENLRKYVRQDFNKIINISVNETLARTVMTVLTTILVCITLAIFGGQHLKGFSLATLFGIAFGTYSSIYISAPILTLLNTRKLKRTQIYTQ